MAVDASRNIGCKSVTVTVDNGTLPGYLPYTPINVGGVRCDYPLFCPGSFLFQACTCHYLHFLPPIAEILALAKSVHSAASQAQPLGMPAGSDAVAGCGVMWQLPEYSPPATGFKVYRDGEFIGEAPIEEFDVIYPYIEFPRPGTADDMACTLTRISKIESSYTGFRTVYLPTTVQVKAKRALPPTQR